MSVKDIFLNAKLKVRDTQLSMIEQIKNALQSKEHLIIEAGTGVGKTFAYLVGSWLGIKDDEEKKCIVISTNTIALQEQLIEKDLPFLSELIGVRLNYVLAKGRGRYICQRRLDAANNNKSIDIDIIKQLQDKLDNNWSGDRDELKKQPDYELWGEICNSSNHCNGKRCEYIKNCSFINARKKLRKADIIVVNHSLLLSHLSLGDGAILPEFANSIYIIDECHNLPEKALSVFSGQAALIASQTWINDVDKILKTMPGNVLIRTDKPKIDEYKKQLVKSLTEIQNIIDQLYTNHTDDVYLLKNIPGSILSQAKLIKDTASDYLNLVKKVKKNLEDFAEKSDIHSQESLEKQFTSLNFFIEKTANLYYVWDLMCNENNPPIAKWFERKDLISERQSDLLEKSLQDYTACASATDAGPLLQQLFWDKVENSVIMCSATIRSLGSFNRFIEAAGLEPTQKTSCLPSPFEYHKSELIIPNMQSSPQESAIHIKESAAIMAKYLAAHKGALVLFTSLYAMHEAFSYLPVEIQLDTLIQGDKSKSAIISAHKKMIDYGKRSIIFGVASFAEGIDLPGKYLETLLIHKLPFAVPTDPITQTRSDWLEQQGRKSFFEFSLPDASIKLTQMVGRLVRDEDDRGIVVILDNRISKKRYGKMMLDNLPKFKVNAGKMF